MNNLSLFSGFAKTGKNPASGAALKNAVVYTRVSSKEQADKNLSLESQKHIIEEYALRNQYSVAAYFGGTYESAKTDGRKEFRRMLDYVKMSEGEVSHILVYMLDRFSRTGGGAIKLAEELREQYGVDIIAVTQPADTSNAGGVLQQSIQFIFSRYDNDIRKQRAIAGMQAKLAKGIWVTKPPLGYDTIIVNGERKVIVNETGRILQKAFVWKCEGVKNEEILERLRVLGVKIYKQQLSRILQNPFYCGLISHKMLEGKVLEGSQEQVISKEVFLRVNNLISNASGYGVLHKDKSASIPLRRFILCKECRQPFTGYQVKKKNLWYYKCRTKGCCCNKRADELHTLFLHLLNDYCVMPEFLPVIQSNLQQVWAGEDQERSRSERSLKIQLKAIERKMATAAERYYITKDMDKDLFDTFMSGFEQDKQRILQRLQDYSKQLPDPGRAVENDLQELTELEALWLDKPIAHQEALQKLIFPEGVLYDRKTQRLEPVKVGVIFKQRA